MKKLVIFKPFVVGGLTRADAIMINTFEERTQFFSGFQTSFVNSVG